MFSLTRNLMIRTGMFPRNEGLRLHFIKYQAPRLFSALAASSNNALKPTRFRYALVVENIKGRIHLLREAASTMDRMFDQFKSDIGEIFLS